MKWFGGLDPGGRGCNIMDGGRYSAGGAIMQGCGRFNGMALGSHASPITGNLIVADLPGTTLGTVII